MAKIQGLGTAEWGLMMTSLSFALKGTDAHVSLRPADMQGPTPDWWPGETARTIAEGDAITVENIRKAFPNIASVAWGDRPGKFLNSVECIGFFDGLRISILSHVSGGGIVDQDRLDKKHAELQTLGNEFIAMITSSTIS